MAFVVRSGRMVGPLSNYLRPVALANRCISTSNKKDETAVVTEKIASHKPGVESHVDVVATPARKVFEITISPQLEKIYHPIGETLKCVCVVVSRNLSQLIIFFFK